MCRHVFVYRLGDALSEEIAAQRRADFVDEADDQIVETDPVDAAFRLP